MEVWRCPLNMNSRIFRTTTDTKKKKVGKLHSQNFDYNNNKNKDTHSNTSIYKLGVGSFLLYHLFPVHWFKRNIVYNLENPPKELASSKNLTPPIYSQSTGPVEYADCIFASVLNMILNHLMVRLQSWGMWSITQLPLFLGPLWLGVVVPVRVSSVGQIVLLNHLTLCKQMTEIKLNC